MKIVVFVLSNRVGEFVDSKTGKVIYIDLKKFKVTSGKRYKIRIKNSKCLKILGEISNVSIKISSLN